MSEHPMPDLEELSRRLKAVYDPQNGWPVDHPLTRLAHEAADALISEAREAGRLRLALQKIAALDKHSGSSLRSRVSSEMARQALSPPTPDAGE